MSSSYQEKCGETELQHYETTRKTLESDGMVRLLHGAVGLTGEAGEVLDVVKKSVFHNKHLDRALLLEELGDVLWYVSLILNACGSSFEEVQLRNLEKLTLRYPKPEAEK